MKGTRADVRLVELGLCQSREKSALAYNERRGIYKRSTHR